MIYGTTATLGELIWITDCDYRKCLFLFTYLISSDDDGSSMETVPTNSVIAPPRRGGEVGTSMARCGWKGNKEPSLSEV